MSITTVPQDEPSPLRQAMQQWEPLLKEAYPDHAISQVVQQPGRNDPNEIVLYIHLIPAL